MRDSRLFTRTKPPSALRAAKHSTVRHVGWRNVCHLVVICLLVASPHRAVMRVTGSDPAMPGGQASSDTLLSTKGFDAPAVTGAFHYSQRALPASKGEVLRSWARALGGLERLRRIENIYVRG